MKVSTWLLIVMWIGLTFSTAVVVHQDYTIQDQRTLIRQLWQDSQACRSSK